MLVRLLPEQASKHWADIKVAIEAALPPTVGQQSDRMSNILTAILTEEIVAWISVETSEGINTITGIVLTTELFDKVSGTKSMLIYCIYGYGVAKKESWDEGFQTLIKYAKHRGCHRILGYTDVPSILKYAEMMGAETKYHLVSWPL